MAEDTTSIRNFKVEVRCKLSLSNLLGGIQYDYSGWC